MWTASSGGRTAGCNPLHRVAPLAAAAAVPEESLADAARAEADLTHLHPLAQDGAAAVAVLCRSLVLGKTWRVAVADAVASARLPETVTAIGRVPEGPAGKGGYVPEVLQTALHFVDRHGSLREALTAAIEYAGPANYCPVLVGAIGGVCWGVDDALLARFPPTVPVDRLGRLSGALAADWS